MSDDQDRTPGPGWWIASDGELYPPEDHPDTRALLQATATQRLVSAARTGTRHLNDRPDLGGTTTVTPPTDDLGGSLQWASSALRRNLGTLTGVSLLALVLGAVGVGITAALELGVASLEWASLTAVVSLVARVVQLCIVAWVTIAMIRSWKLIADDQPVDFATVFTVQGLLPTLITFVLVAPIMFVTGGTAVAFAIVALLFTTHSHLSPFGAIGRMLADTCNSAKRFFQTLLIGALFALFSMAITVVASVVFVQVTTGVALSSFSNTFGDSSELRETDANLTLLGGTLLTAVVSIALGLLLWNMIGLWTAAYSRRLTVADQPAG